MYSIVITSYIQCYRTRNVSQPCVSVVCLKTCSFPSGLDRECIIHGLQYVYWSWFSVYSEHRYLDETLNVIKGNNRISQRETMLKHTRTFLAVKVSSSRNSCTCTVINLLSLLYPDPLCMSRDPPTDRASFSTRREVAATFRLTWCCVFAAPQRRLCQITTLKVAVLQGGCCRSAAEAQTLHCHRNPTSPFPPPALPPTVMYTHTDCSKRYKCTVILSSSR